MASDLYDALHIPPEASQEEIRKAYKKRALQTHPDRLPPNATAAEKAASEDKFRKVNNAYEILKDPQKRRTYDAHGVWPPPREELRPNASHYQHSRHQRPYDYPRYSDAFFSASRDFHFTDPFELFDSFFHGHSPRHRAHRRRSAFEHEAFGFPSVHNEVDNFMSNMERNRAASMGMGFSSFSPMRSHFGFPAFPSVAMDMGSGSGSSGGRWASESTMSQTINGVTHTIRKRRDWDGNEHVTRIYPDGRKVVTLNGVEQHDQGHVPPPPTNNHNNYLPSGPPPPYSATPGGVMNYDEHPIIPSYRNNPALYNNEGNHTVPSPTHSKKRWWRSRA